MENKIIEMGKNYKIEIKSRRRLWEVKHQRVPEEEVPGVNAAHRIVVPEWCGGKYNKRNEESAGDGGKASVTKKAMTFFLVSFLTEKI